MREFRPGKSIVPMIVWSTLATGIALLIRNRLDRPVTLLLFSALLLLGPVATLLHALRAWALGVRVHPDRGLLFRNGREVSWDALRAVRHRPCPFDRDEAPGSAKSNSFLEDTPDGAHDAVIWVFVLHLLWVLLYYLLLPAFGVLSPWAARVELSLKDGSEIVLKDLEEDRFFVKLLKIGLGGRRDRVERLARELHEAA